MIYTKTNPVGIDIPIDNLNLKIANYLYSIWSLTDSNSDFYGRVYRNKTKSGYIPEGFVTTYKDVLFNTKKNCTSFFYVNGQPSNDLGNWTANIVHVLQILLDQVYPDITHRADEEIRKDLNSIYDLQPFQFILNRFSHNISEVFIDFDINLKDYYDMQPLFNLRLDLTLNYKYR